MEDKTSMGKGGETMGVVYTVATVATLLGDGSSILVRVGNINQHNTRRRN